MLRFAAAGAAFGVVVSSFGTPWGNGDLAVLQIDGNGAALSANGARVHLLRLDRATGASLSGAIDLTFNGTDGIVVSGNSTSEGAINGVGMMVTAGGYPYAVGTGSLTGQSARRVVQVDLSAGSIFRQQDVPLSGSIRDAMSFNGNEFAVSTSASGIQHGVYGSSSVVGYGTTGNTRYLGALNNAPFFSTSAGGAFVISDAVTSTPVVDLSGTGIIIADFAFTADGRTVYLASDSTSVGGIYRISRPNTAVPFAAADRVRIFGSAVRNIAIAETGTRVEAFASQKSSTVNQLYGFLHADTAMGIVGPDWNLSDTTTNGYVGLAVVSPELRGYGFLTGWSGSPSDLTVNVDVQDLAGNPLFSGSAPWEADGTWRLPMPVSVTAGNVQIFVQTRTSLRQLFNANTYMDRYGAFGIGMALTNGDIDGDNEVGLSDFGILSGAFGTFDGDPGFHPYADLDGDGEVGLSDFGILSGSFGQIGD